MSKSKLTLIIDGNWLLMSRLSVLNGRYVDDLELCHYLKMLMIRSISVVLRKFPKIDNIIFVADGGSWRSQVKLPNWLEKYKEEDHIIVDYKGTRTKSEDINWELIFSAYEEFMSVLNVTGINVFREQFIEGDDWCWWWSNYLNSQDTNCIIWTKDNDLKQLVNMNKNNCFTTWWNNDAGLFINDFEEQELDFLFNTSYNENNQIWDELVKQAKNVTKINPYYIVIDKILKGDTSDNILPVILRTSKTGSDKKFKISAKDINYSLNINNKDEVKEYLHNLINSKNYVNRLFKNKSEQDIIDHFMFNQKLISLNKNSYPKEILDILESHTDYNKSKDISIAESQIIASSNGLDSILNII